MAYQMLTHEVWVILRQQKFISHDTAVLIISNSVQFCTNNKMHLFTTSLLLDLLGLTITLAIVIYTYFKWSFQYWERKGVPYVPPKIPFGNVDNMLTRKRNLGTIMKDLYDQLKAKNAKFGGFYTMTRAQFIPVDPEVVKNILVKDFRLVIRRFLEYFFCHGPLNYYVTYLDHRFLSARSV